ncbi:hypothetical protein [Nocardia inohanensis]|uniref:hypothetical protein n=1 Tax=Nocardia inohanensis TaxID=209246 RepID=UPI00082F771C|nr:hypothetical protein [Nocardia inohanensis]
MAEYGRPPIRPIDLTVAVLIYLLGAGFGWFAALLVPQYAVLLHAPADSRHLPLAYAIGWAGIAITLMVVPLWILREVQFRQRSWPTALLVFPLVALSWVLGLLVALLAAGKPG